MSRLPNSNHIVQFFLDLYRRQIGIPAMGACSMSFNELKKLNKSDEITYELKVTYNGREKIRRMSLCRLGEDMQSRSTCYKVIYDDLLVLKIPPEPITDFNQYLKSIELERAIAGRLGPEVPCVSPSLSAILDKSPEFKNDRGLKEGGLGKRNHHEAETITKSATVFKSWWNLCPLHGAFQGSVF